MDQPVPDWIDCPECGMQVYAVDGKIVAHTTQTVTLAEFALAWPNLDVMLCPASEREVTV